MTIVLRLAAALLAVCLSLVPFHADTYSTGFESYSDGDLAETDGWGRYVNSPTSGAVEAAPTGTAASLGSKSLRLYTFDEGMLGVANHFYSPLVDAAGETGSTLAGDVVASPHSTFTASLWYRTPDTAVISTAGAVGRFAELNPSSKGTGTDLQDLTANRYANVRVYNTTNTAAGVPRVEMRWYDSTSPSAISTNVATLQWGQWYRFEYHIRFVDGLNGADPNDRFKLTIYDADGNEVGSACGFTMEVGWKSGSFGGGTTPRAINGFDFWSTSKPTGHLAGHLDEVTYQTSSSPAVQVAISGNLNVCETGATTTTLTANISNGLAPYMTTWRDSNGDVIGTTNDVIVGAGDYTVTVQDGFCMTATANVTVTAVSCTITPTVTWNDPDDIFYGTALSSTQLDATASVPGTFTYTPPSGTILNAGAAQVLSVDFQPDDPSSYDPVLGTTVNINVLPATPTVTVSGGPFVYDGSPHSATAEARDGNGNLVAGAFTLEYDGSTAEPANAGSYDVDAAFVSSNPNFNDATGNGTLVITRATPVVTWSDPTFIAYGTALSGVQLDATADVPGTFTYTPAAGTVLPAGDDQELRVDFVPTDTTNYNTVSGTIVHIDVLAIDPVITVTGGTFPYDGLPHAASATAEDGSGNTVAGAFTFTYDLSPTAPMNVGSYAVVASFASDNSNFNDAAGNGTLVITRATPVVTWSDPTFIAYGTALSGVQLDATADVPGTFTYTPAAGTVLPAGDDQELRVDFVPTDTTNYNTVSGTIVHIDVLAVDPVITVTGGTFPYDGLPHAASATAEDGSGNPVAGAFTFTYDLSPTAPTNVGSYAVVASFASDDPNFNDATGSGTLVITRATPVVTWSDPPFIAYGTALSGVQLDATADVPGTFTYTPAAGTVLPAGDDQELRVDFVPTDTTNYNTVSGTIVHIDVLAIDPVITVTGGTFPYDGLPHAASATAEDGSGNPVAGAFTFTYDLSPTAPTNVGSYAVVASFASADPNFNDATGSGTLVITRAMPLLSWSDPAAITFGTALDETQLNATASVPGTFSYSPPAGTLLDVGDDQQLSVEFLPADTVNYETPAPTTVSIDVLPASPLIILITGTFVYDGTARVATAHAENAAGIPVPGTITITYNGNPSPPVNAGIYTVVASFDSSDDNYADTTAGATLTILRATPAVTWNDPAPVVFGMPLGAAQLDATATVPGMWTYTPPAGTVLDAGAGQTLRVDFLPLDSINYNSVPGTTVLIDVLPASTLVTVSGGPFVYDGNSHAATATAHDLSSNPVAGTIVLTYDGSTSAPVNAGTYAVVATFTSSDPNYADAIGTGTLVIARATPVVSWPAPATIVYGTPLSGLQLNATADVPGTWIYTPPAGTVLDAGNAQTLSVDFTPADLINYEPVAGTIVFIDVLPVTPVVTVTGGTFVYDGSAKQATAIAQNGPDTIPGTFAFTYTDNPVPPVHAGTYLVVATFTSLDPNFGAATGTAILEITQATPIVNWDDPAPIVFGTRLGSEQLNATANVPGTFNYSPAAGILLNAGNGQTLYADFTPLDATNYVPVNGVTAMIDVLPALPVISVDAGTFVYDGAPHTARATATHELDPSVSGSFTFSYDGVAALPVAAGTYDVVASFTSTDPDFSNATGTGTLVIERRPTFLSIEAITPSPSEAGEPVSVSFALLSLVGAAGGSVTISDGVDSCTAPLAASGSCVLRFRTQGSRDVTAVYTGDSNHLPSNSTVVVHDVTGTLPTARVLGSNTICAGSEAVVELRLTGDAPFTVTWSDGLVETIGARSHTRTVSPAVTTTYSIAAVANASGSGTVSGAAVITVNAAPRPSILNAPRYEPGQPFTLRATPGYTSYRWYHDGVLVPDETSSELTIEAASQDDLGSYWVTAMMGECLSPPSGVFVLVAGGDLADHAVIPVVGSVHGAGGSLFRTTVHLTNPTDEVMEGVMTFTHAALSDRIYFVAPGDTIFLDDLLPEEFNGLTSVNVRRTRGALPVAVVHVFNDGREQGTSGMIERIVPLERTLVQGDRAVLLTPADPVATRLNVGLRSLSDGLRVRVVRRDAAGEILGSIERSVPPSTLVHEPASALIRTSIEGTASLTVEILEGRGVIYGAATDNGTNDPNMQIAEAVTARRGSGVYVLPVAGAVRGNFNSRFATALQVHNPADVPLEAALVFHPAGVSTADGDTRMSVVVAPHATVTMEDVVGEMHAQGLGTLTLTTTADSRPVVRARVYSIAEEGQTSAMMDLVAEEEALRAGDRGVLVAPHAPGRARFNIGIRTLQAVRMMATVRNAQGAVVKQRLLSLPSNLYSHQSAPALLDHPLTGDESITFTLEEGRAVIYGVWTDNVTQDPSLQNATAF